MHDMNQLLIELSRRKKQLLMIVFDAIIIILSIFIAFSLRWSYWYFSQIEDLNLLLFIFLSPLLALSIFHKFGLYTEVIRYVGFHSIWKVIQATTLYSFLWGLIILFLFNQNISTSIILINWLLVVIFIGGSRLFARWLILEINIINIEIKKNRVLVYGAGSAGRQLSNALASSNEYKPVAFLDDSIEIYQQSINGLTVYSRDDLQKIIEKKEIKEVFLAMPSISRARRKEIINYFEPYSLLVKTLPSISNLVRGKVRVDDLLEIDLRDLLGRDPVKPNMSLLKINISNKVVLVTGAGGSIGSELCRQIVRQNPKKLILYDISEPSLYQIEQELISINEDQLEIVPVLGSIADIVRFQNICKSYVVQTIYHSAAYKHVPLVEFNQSQGVLNNIIGTKLAAEAAINACVETFVLISTDKAVRPTNVMGASKRISEMVLQALNVQQSITCFTMVRFGNVLDSSGSVIPLFKKQIRSGGPVTVTHANVVRYFMTIPEAVELVIQAGAMAKGGEVFVLDMGEPILIYDLAVKMIKLSGLQVKDKDNLKGDIEIKYTGLRAGEKLYEELLVGDNVSKTENANIKSAKEDMLIWSKLEPLLSKIKEAAINNDTKAIYKFLKQIVPQFNSEFNGHDVMNKKQGDKT
jgi:FlaA1/EpsC-like NDP-sugar epimerase